MLSKCIKTEDPKFRLNSGPSGFSGTTFDFVFTLKTLYLVSFGVFVSAQPHNVNLELLFFHSDKLLDLKSHTETMKTANMRNETFLLRKFQKQQTCKQLFTTRSHINVFVPIQNQFPSPTRLRPDPSWVSLHLLSTGGQRFDTEQENDDTPNTLNVTNVRTRHRSSLAAIIRDDNILEKLWRKIIYLVFLSQSTLTIYKLDQRHLISVM